LCFEAERRGQLAVAYAWEQRPGVDVREMMEAADVRRRAEDERSLLLCPGIPLVAPRFAGLEQLW
jgi:hypothetical protein